jgi:rhodanese-related sulfurtransferase
VQRWLLIRFLRMVRISVDDLRAMIDEGHQPVIFDVRSALAREAEPRRIPGAILAELDAIERMLGHVPPGRDVVVYCS